MSEVVLVHGFLRRGRNMRYLARKLAERGWRTFAPTLPTTLQSVRACGDLLSQMLQRRGFGEGPVHFVGHSMGGLVIRDCLSRMKIRELGKVVLIGTPNGGSPYANLLLGFPFFRKIRSLRDLAEPGPDIPPPLNIPNPEIGLVIGTRPDPVRKFFLPGEHDGLVAADSVRRVTASAEILIPCSHERLHWRPGTAEAVILFLETGKFQK